MRDAGDHYEYIAVYCHDLTIAPKTQNLITDLLTEKHKFKLKEGTGPMTSLLGCNYTHVMTMEPSAWHHKSISRR